MNGRAGTVLGTLLVVVALLATGVAVTSGVVADPGPASAGTSPALATEETDQVDPDEIRIDIDLAADGSATWEIQYWVRLANDDEVQAFEELQADVDDDPDVYTNRFADRMEATVATAEDATGREMAADEFAVAADRHSLTREYGVLTYSFRWEGFAAVDGGELHAGDAIEQFYLDDDTRLTMTWPDGYELVSVTPDPDDGRDRVVVWQGSETDFVSGEPRVVVSDGESSSGYATVAVAAALGVGAVAALWWTRRRTSVEAGETRPAAESADDSRADRDPEQFLSNEERVLRLLEERGGRMKQQEVVSELGWTDAKTSQVVSGLRDDGELESFRLGRENVLVLPGGDDT